ncbi:MAG: 16S rRNA (cytidine(1402)-2'-O)-methyltransferase [Candidatus Pelagibacter sp.]|tara:strand:+ start:53 stop:916 length:864 start_codon:yes stop_codon:yes gene_type:complete
MAINPLSHNKEIKKGLYLVPTPIGNLGDITFRAIEILKKSDLILCEDTRVSAKLFEKFEIKSKLLSNHKFNEKKNLSKVISGLKNGQIVSLISDAGTPGISDPGAILVKECVKEKIDITPLPGASAVNTSISASGFSEKYFFYGFFPTKLKNIRDDLRSLSSLDASIVFFISSKKLNKAIPVIKQNFSGREIMICREMTKFYEEYLRYKVEDLKIFAETLKGELTIVLSEKKRVKKGSLFLSESDKKDIKKMIKKLSIKEITNLISRNNNIPKKEIYNYCVKVKNEN